MEKPEHTLEWLLDYDGRRHFFASGHFVKFEIRLVEQSGQVPHGIAYSFTFHDPDGTRLLGFDNAHPVPHAGGKFVKAKPNADHWHRTFNDEGRPYAFVSAAQLLEDFFTEVEKLCKAQSILTEVVDDKEE
jgi:Family of unknown function (DUF6516)